MDYSSDSIMHLALGTSLATIIVTSISSLMAHNKKGAVMWPVFKNLAPGLALGCFLGAGIAGQISGLYLQLIVGVFLLWVAYKMFFAGKKPVANHSSGANDVSSVNYANTALPSKPRSEEHTSELQSRENLVCRLLLEKKKKYDEESTNL